MSKNIVKSAIDWAAMEKVIPPQQKANFLAFKAKSDGYLRRVISLPTAPPPIDWESYRKSVPVEGMVDAFKKQYESVTVPYPDDSVSCELDKLWESQQVDIKNYCDASAKTVEELSKELQRLKALPKFDEMTVEMFFEMYPEQALSLEKPTFWPHKDGRK